MSARNWKPIVLALLVLLGANQALALDLGGHDRDGFVFGLVVGHGWNAIHTADINGESQGTNHMAAFNGALKFGWAWNDALVGFIGMSGWSRGANQDTAPASATNLNLLAELYYFPGGRGFWLKGGAGAGSLDYFLNAAEPGGNIVFKESGYALTFGTGFEVRLRGRYGVGLSYDYTRLDINDFGNITGARTGNQVIAVSILMYGS